MHRQGQGVTDPATARSSTKRPAARGSASPRRSRGDGEAEMPHGALTKPRKSYRLGRFLAQLLGVTGLVGAIAGLVALGANLVLWATNMQNALLSLLATSPTVAMALTVVACLLILLSQMAKATFDAASNHLRKEPEE